MMSCMHAKLSNMNSYEAWTFNIILQLYNMSLQNNNNNLGVGL